SQRTFARVEDRRFQPGKGALSVGLAERNQSNARGNAVADECVQERTKSGANRNALCGRSNGDHNRQYRLDPWRLKRLQERVQQRMGPHVAQRGKTGGALLRRLQCEFGRSSKCGGELRSLDEPSDMCPRRAAPGCDKEDRVVAAGAITKIRVQPVD